jgi:ribosomal protein L12E/L44/L45/RPP1/RPP2
VGFPRRWRLASCTACSALALLAAGCGGDEPSAREQALLPEPLASDLARQADGVGREAASGDTAEARDRAEALRRDVVAAIHSGRIPDELADVLLASVDRLVALIPGSAAGPTPEPAPASEKKEKKKKEKGEDESEETTTEAGTGGMTATTGTTATTATTPTTTGATTQATTQATTTEDGDEGGAEVGGAGTTGNG